MATLRVWSPLTRGKGVREGTDLEGKEVGRMREKGWEERGPKVHFRFAHQRKDAQHCRKSVESKFRTISCKYTFSNAPFLKFLRTSKSLEKVSNGHLLRADFWEGDEDSNFSIFRVQTSSLTCLFCRNPYPKDPAVLKILRDSESLRRSVFTTPPRFTTP